MHRNISWFIDPSQMAGAANPGGGISYKYMFLKSVLLAFSLHKDPVRQALQTSAVHT
jgi:hypothetical protein